MIDPLGTATRISLYTTHLLINDLTNILKSPSPIPVLLSEISAVETARKPLQKTISAEWKFFGSTIPKQLETVVRNYEKLCEGLRAEVGSSLQLQRRRLGSLRLG
ncbi:hypothetical protein CC80DRAFT_548917 [Byssothecium circinans]|uniref:Uncharacterized protein n=1 Tax=Byssothecium circinans TaxID=147558 RepID=A0A6A5TUZ6_9PLEO|nr:hypothetical protein CC80DRAFT_548917 [Byssothecium circinans]